MNKLNKLPRRYKLHIPLVLIGVVLLALLPTSCTCNRTPADGEVGGDWNPGGLGVTVPRIIFWMDYGNTREIYSIHADGSNQTNLTNNTMYDYDPAWSPDSTKIAYTSDRDRNHQVYVMNSDGSNNVALTSEDEFGLAVDPKWSPDGTKIVFKCVAAVGKTIDFELYVMDSDGANKVNLTNYPSLVTTASDYSWFPDGSGIICQCFGVDGGNVNLIIVNIDTQATSVIYSYFRS